MKLEDQVCSLELAKRLKELGVAQYSFFYWIKRKLKKHRPFVSCLVGDHHIEIASAFTVAELGEMLPHGFWSSKSADGYDCGFEQDLEQYVETKKTEADARAKMLIYLLENKLLTPKE